MKRTILLLLFLTSISWCFPQKPTYKIDYYSPRNYGKGREANNWAVVQDKNGVLYFGNAGGLLQYDGVNWVFIPVKNQSSWVKSLAVSDDNIIYVGAQKEFGYLAPDKSGKLTYISLSDQLKDDKISFSSIIRIWVWNEIVAFQFEEAVFLYSNGTLTTILPETSFHISYLINNEFFIRQRGIGIMKLTENKLELVRGSEYLKDAGIFSIIESSDKKNNIIITPEDGLWLVDKNTFQGSIIKTADSIILKKSGIYGATRLKDGKIVLNTLSNGILITDDSFRILSVINKDNGLKVNGSLSLIQDYQGNLWSGLENGIANIHYSSPVSTFAIEAGISGNIKSILRYKENLFIGTSDGLFVQNNSNKIADAPFISYGGLNKEIKGLCLAEGCLLAGTRDGLFEIRNNVITKIENIEISALYYSNKLKTLFVSGKKNLALYKYSGKWNKLKDISEITEDVVRFEETISIEGAEIWMGTSLQGIVRLQITSASKYKVDKYGSEDGLISDDWALPFKIDNKVVFSQRNGLLSFVDEKTMQDKLPDSLKNRSEFYRGFFDYYRIDTTKEQISMPYYFIEDAGDRIYINLDGDVGYISKSGSNQFINQPFCLADIGKVNVIYHEDNGLCWFGGDDGLLLFNENNDKDYQIDFNSLIHKVTCGVEDSVIYYGYSYNQSSINSTEPTPQQFNLSHNLNTVSFAFAAPFFEGQEKIKYSYVLLGLDTIYSPWSSENKIVFRNLWEGEYVFKVKAINAYGHISSERTFEFRILPPWYRKIWMYGLYILIFAASIYAGIRLNTRRLLALNRKLEIVILERTHEIQEKNIELESQKGEILDSINYALRIQKAVMPQDDVIQGCIGDHFIIHRPKDIVSGDFYWITTLNQYVIFCVADCTGHGVPGAFMSMLCISFLNEIVLREEITHTDEILNKVRDMIIESLKQKGVMGEQKDGMDIAICTFNRETSILEFSGANNPLFIIRGKEKMLIPDFKQIESNDFILYEIKGDRMPISIYDIMNPFKRHSIELLKDDRLYLFSDGICDQFGGPNNRRIMISSLKTILLETVTPEIKDQGQLVENVLDNWMSHLNLCTGQHYKQIDDICLFGIRI